jgi:hypothetical protein
MMDPLTAQRKQQLNLTLDKRKLRRFDIGSKVRVLDVRSGKWYKGTITGQESCKVYIVETSKGTIRLHLDHLIVLIWIFIRRISWPMNLARSKIK